jgi:hypothetical protein
MVSTILDIFLFCCKKITGLKALIPAVFPFTGVRLQVLSGKVRLCLLSAGRHLLLQLKQKHLAHQSTTAIPAKFLFSSINRMQFIKKLTEIPVSPFIPPRRLT